MEGKIKIVVIDDERDICLLIKENLEITGRFAVITTSSPLEAEQLCQQEQPDLILMDVVMPNRKGSDIVESLKKDPGTKRIPIIIMSGLGEMVYFKDKDKWSWLPNMPIVKERGEIIHEFNPNIAAQAYGVRAYIDKPFGAKRLIELIDEVLGLSK
ncbi:MAG: response regulator [Candidatus Omnitrophota bacterium]